MNMMKRIASYGSVTQLGVILLATAVGLTGCTGSQDRSPIEVTELAGLRIDESRMQAQPNGSSLDFQIVLERTEDKVFQGVLEADIRDLDGRHIDRQVRNFELKESERSFHLQFEGIESDLGLEELARYLVDYRVKWDKHTLFGSRSVYAAAEKLEVQVLAPSRLHEGAGSYLRAMARNPTSGEARADVTVLVELQFEDRRLVLGQGRTDAMGAAEIFLRSPSGTVGQGQMVVTIDPPQGEVETLSGVVEIMREEKILLTTDKPIYQPGQTMHLRSLSLRRPALWPVADEAFVFEVRDGKGNKVFKEQGLTNAFGIASADFRLAGEVNMGPFEILCRVGSTESIKTVEVKRYALPKFGVSFSPNQGYYLPGQRVTGQVQAGYFFGKPVANAQVRVKVLTFDVGLSEIGEVVGQTDDEGFFGFAYQLPNVFAGIDLLQGDAYLQFDVEVTDLAEHAEQVSVVSVVAAEPLKVSLVPESGELVPGLPNQIHVVSADPTGRPLSAVVQVSAAGQLPVSVNTDARGLGSFSLTPAADSESLSLHVHATSALGSETERDIVLAAGQGHSTVLLRVDQRLAQVGDTINLTIWADDKQDRIYLDAIKGNQTLMTHALDLVDGQAHYALELTPDMEGNVQFDAYYLTPASQIVRDRQLVLVQGARQLQVEISMDKAEYRPGEPAQINFQVSDPQGQGMPAALGLSIVDEAVFALTEFRPGLAEVFFEVEQEILTPSVQIVRSSSLDDYLDTDRSDEEREASAQVAFAAAQGFADQGFSKNTYVDASRAVAALIKQRVNSDTDEIVKDLQAQAEHGLVTRENIRAWLSGKEDRWSDPFGKPYRLELVGTSTWNQTLVVHSAGPDERIGSPDDVASDARGTWEFFSGYDRDEGGWGFEDGDVAGGGPDPTNDGEQPPGDHGDEKSNSQAPRVRSYFPETLLFEPALITDDSGHASLELSMADSITTWRMTSLANSLDGRIGSRADGILVFQDFFVDVDFPATLTRGDQVSVPVAVYNYLEVPQTVRLELQTEDWFVLQDSASKSIDLDASGVGVVYFTVIVDQVGWHGLTVMGYGSQLSDAVRRTVEVVPNGKEFREGRSDRLAGSITRSLHVPAEAIDGASRIFVKVYPGLMSQTVEGLDSLLRIPTGCFEQTTTTAWPNILVLNYLQASGQLTPEIELKARDFVNQSYQRIVTFECPSGGFNWWVGDDPGNAILSAMALMMFADAKQSVDLDQNVVARTEAYLVSTQQADGSWSGESHLHAGNEIYGESQLRASAFCTWGLAMSTYNGAALGAATSYLRSALPGTDDTYTQALVANALAGVDVNDPVLLNLLNELAAAKQTGDEGVVFWQATGATASGGSGTNGDVETTAMIVQALLKTGMHPDLVQGAITWLIQKKDTFGTWHTTQPTVQTLRAMSMALAQNTSQDVNGTVAVSINGADDVCTFSVTPDNSDVTRICELNEYTVEGDNQVTVSLNGEGSFLYQAVAVYYLPWDLVADSPDGPLSIDVSYDRTQLAVDETVDVLVTVSYNIPGERASMIMIDLGIPPGFELETEALAALVTEQVHITRTEIRGRQLSIYVDELAYGEPLSFSYPMKAKYPIDGTCPESTVWAYYNPEVKSVSRPVGFQVVP